VKQRRIDQEEREHLRAKLALLREDIRRLDAHVECQAALVRQYGDMGQRSGEVGAPYGDAIRRYNADLERLKRMIAGL
jgi:hypothetical protein